MKKRGRMGVQINAVSVSGAETMQQSADADDMCLCVKMAGESIVLLNPKP